MAADVTMLMGWLRQELARGCTPGSLLRAMQDSGWSLDDAARALTAAASSEPEKPGGFTGAPRASRVDVVRAGQQRPQLQRLDGAAEANVIRVLDRDVRVLAEWQQPRVVVVADLLSADECAELVEAARGRLSRSQTVSAVEAVTAEVNAARTSEGMFFQRAEIAIVAKLEARLEALFGWPQDQSEGLQVLRYTPGAEYRPHYDHFDVQTPGGQTALSRGGQRVGTILVYLVTPPQGGATIFPDAGLSVRAQAGHAVFFGYDLAAGEGGVLHGGAPVMAGEKWVATKWLREKKFA